MKMIQELLDGATALGACRKTDGIDTLDKLVALYESPQGREFCAKHNYPSREQWTKISQYWSKDELHRRHIYINEPEPLALYNPGTAVSVGTCLHATFSGADRTQRLIALHGTKATICANNYAVFAVESDNTTDVTISKDGTSIQL